MIVTKTHEFTGHRDCIYTAAINYPLQQLYTAGGDGFVASWDCLRGGDGAMQVRVGSAVYSMALKEDKLLLGSNKGNLYVVDPETKTEERNIEAHSGGIFDIVYDEETATLYTAGFDGVLNVWSADLQLKTAIKLSGKSLRNICLLPGSIAIACSDFSIYIIDKENLGVTAILESHTNSVFSLAYNPVKKELLSGGRDCYLKIWDGETYKLKQEYVGAKLHINHISFNPGYALYAVSSMDKTIKIFDSESHQPLKFIDKEKNNGHTSSINKSLWLDEKTLLSVSDDKKAICWTLE